MNTPEPDQSQPCAGEGWRPIESAPKEPITENAINDFLPARTGPILQLVVPFMSDCVTVGFWSPDDNCWRHLDDDGGHDIQPTLWAPLLAAPAALPSAGEGERAPATLREALEYVADERFAKIASGEAFLDGHMLGELHRLAKAVLAALHPPGQGEGERLQRELEREEASHENTIDQRDRAEKAADTLAALIARMTGVQIGEHSNVNCPWEKAAEAAEEALAETPQPLPGEGVEDLRGRAEHRGEALQFIADLDDPASHADLITLIALYGLGHTLPQDDAAEVRAALVGWSAARDAEFGHDA